MPTQLLLDQLLALPLAERITLAEALWDSITDGLPAPDERESTATATRRDAELTAGTVPGRTHDEVMRTARWAIVEC